MFLPGVEIVLDRIMIVELRKACAGMRSARPDDHGKCKIGRDVATCIGRRRRLRKLFARNSYRCRNLKAGNSVEHAMQLVAIEIAYMLRRIEQRTRPQRRGLIDLAQRIAAIFGVGRDHDGDVVIGQRHRPFDFRHDI